MRRCIMIYTNVSKLRDELKKLLIDCGMTQRQIAERLDISPQQLSNLFSKKNFSLDDAKKIADALGATLEVNIIMPDGTKI